MTAALEDVKTIEIEDWLTLNTSASPTKLKQGQTPNAKNVWVDEKPGSVITANGFIKVGEIPSGNSPTFCIDYFKSSTGSQIFVVSDNSTVWTTVDFQTFTSIITGLSSSFQLRGLVVRDKLWLTNGSDAVRTFDGSTVTTLDGNGGTPNVPKGRYLSYHDERVFMYHTSSNRSGAYFTALTDSGGSIIAPDNSAAWPSDNLLQVSEGDADFGTGLILYRETLFFFKQYSIWRLVGYDEYTYSRVKTRSSTGTRFNESLQILDGLVHLIGTDGLYVFDGEDTDRISDIIDPATASQTAFGFNQLQQPNVNNEFWETTETADWNLGTLSRNLVVDDSISVEASDSLTADFNAGATLTNLDTSSDEIKLSTGTTGVSSKNIALGKTGVLTPNSNTGTIGSAPMLTDGNSSNAVGFSGSPSAASGSFGITGLPSVAITTVILKNVVCGSSGSNSPHASFNTESLDLTPSSVSGGAILVGRDVFFVANSTVTITFPHFTASALSMTVLFLANTSFTVTEIEIYTGAYNPTGKFVSRTLDLLTTPANAGTLRVDYDNVSGGTVDFFTQTSADGTTWDAEITAIAALSGAGQAAIGSTPKRYIRWGANFTSDGLNSPVVRFVDLPATFISPIHDTGGNIFSWGPLESEYSQFGTDIRFYYRTATTSGGVSTAAWNLIVPGGSLNDSVLNKFVQFKIEFSGNIGTDPVVSNVTVNWVVGSGTQPQISQNVASIVWRNRYWMSAAGPGATENDTILIRGKKTFGNPWQLKDWAIACFTKFQNSLYGGSSVDGSIYKLDTGYSANGAELDCYFETGDFVFGGLQADLVEVLVEVERTGSYSLTVGVSIDRGVTWDEKDVDLTVGTKTASYIKRLNFCNKGDRLRFRVRINGIDEPFEVHRLIAMYKISSARGSLN